MLRYGFEYFRGSLTIQGRGTFGQAVADSLADLAAVRLAKRTRRLWSVSLRCTFPRAHRAATGDEIPDDAYRMEPLVWCA
jgi:hypothetical protein